MTISQPAIRSKKIEFKPEEYPSLRISFDGFDYTAMSLFRKS